MQIEQLDKQVRSTMNAICDIQAASSILNWDQETYMPGGAAETRAEQIATLDSLAHQFLTNAQSTLLVDEIQNAGEQGDNMPLLQLFKEEVEKAAKLPEDLVRKTSKRVSLAHESWKRAKKESDFSLFLPDLRELVELKKEAADLYGWEHNRYDALLNLYEPQMTVKQLIPVFDRLKTATAEILHLISPKSAAVNDEALKKYYPKDRQLRFSRFIAEKMGFAFMNGRIDLSAHPFCTSFSQYDVRLTTRVDEYDLSSCLYGVIHEAGHGLYEQGFSPEWARTFAADGSSMGIHESQSLLWETIIARSAEFSAFALPHLQGFFPGVVDDLKSKDLFKAINCIKPSLIRVNADEITYNLHIILRFEIEREMIAGTVNLEDIPELWNEKMRQYLGITPPNDAEGCLQDIHWSFGGFGYFPSYTLGKLYAAMLWETLQKEFPHILENISRGDFLEIREWLRINIHRYGKTLKPAEVIRLATGGAELSPEPFIAYSRKKALEVYS